MEKSIPESYFRENIVRAHFDSPGECYNALASQYDTASASLSTVEAKYLFRGESRYFPTSTPGTFRALSMDCPLELKIARIDVTDMFVDDYEVAGGDREIGECLAQHYLSTSDGLDFSASLGVALAFALGEKEEDIHRTAYVAVLNRARTDISNRFRLRDLRELRDALRPVRQHGFVAVHEAGNFIDLKAADCRNELGLEWYSFNVAPGDVCKQRHPKAPNLDALYDIRGDQWAARMIEHLSDQVRFPSPQWGQLGHRHLIDTLSALLSRNKS